MWQLQDLQKGLYFSAMSLLFKNGGLQYRDLLFIISEVLVKIAEHDFILKKDLKGDTMRYYAFEMLIFFPLKGQKNKSSYE